MLKLATFHGGRTNARGCCPGCGETVDRVHAWSTASARDVYDCPRCGTFEYTSDGAALPARLHAALPTVMDPVDCIT